MSSTNNNTSSKNTITLSAYINPPASSWREQRTMIPACLETQESLHIAASRASTKGLFNLPPEPEPEQMYAHKCTQTHTKPSTYNVYNVVWRTPCHNTHSSHHTHTHAKPHYILHAIPSAVGLWGVGPLLILLLVLFAL